MTTTPVPTCTDDLLAEIDRLNRWKSESNEVLGPVLDYAGSLGIAKPGESLTATLIDSHKDLTARLHAAEEEIGRRNAFQHEQMTFFTIPILRFAAEVGITDGEPQEKVQALIERMHAAEKDAGRYRWLTRQAWFQSAFDRYDIDDGGLQSIFERECAHIIDKSIQSEASK